jgi:hypothetical protein
MLSGDGAVDRHSGSTLAGPHWTGTKPAALKYANACSMVYVFSL